VAADDASFSFDSIAPLTPVAHGTSLKINVTVKRGQAQPGGV